MFLTLPGKFWRFEQFEIFWPNDNVKNFQREEHLQIFGAMNGLVQFWRVE